MSKERPILFSAPMVRAILEGRKTETRRLVVGMRAAPGVRLRWPSRDAVHKLSGAGDYGWIDQEDGTWRLVGAIWSVKQAMTLPRDAPQPVVRCPYGQPVDRLWVRESHAVESNQMCGGDPPFDDGRPIRRDGDGVWWQCHYRATDPAPGDPVMGVCSQARRVGWRPARATTSEENRDGDD